MSQVGKGKLQNPLGNYRDFTKSGWLEMEQTRGGSEKKGANGNHTMESSKQIWKGPATKVPSESPLPHSVNSINTGQKQNFSSQNENGNSYHFNIYWYSVQSLSHVRLFATPWTAAHQASLSIANSSDAIQPSHPLSYPSPPTYNLAQHQGLFQWVSSSHQVARVLGLQHQSFWWTFRTDFL